MFESDRFFVNVYVLKSLRHLEMTHFSLQGIIPIILCAQYEMLQAPMFFLLPLNKKTIIIYWEILAARRGQ